MITPTQIKLLIGAAFIAALCYVSYDYGATSITKKWQAERISIDDKTKLALIKMNDKSAKLSDNLADAKAVSNQVRIVTKTETLEVEKEVIKYVTKYRDNVCVLDAEWLRVYNRSIDRTKAATTTTK
jgi:hypothetical protein